MSSSVRWFVIIVAMLTATVSTWAFVANMVGPLFVPAFEIDSASADPSRPKWNFFGPYEQWDNAEPAASVNSPPKTFSPPWWYITAQAPDPYWIPWLAGPVGTFGFGTLSLAALVFIALVARNAKTTP